MSNKELNRLATHAEVVDKLIYEKDTGKFYNRHIHSHPEITTKKIRVGTRAYLRHMMAKYYIDGIYPTNVVGFRDGDKTNCSYNNLVDVYHLPIAPNKLLRGSTKLVDGVTMRECTICGEIKEEMEANFYIRENGKFRSECKMCTSKRKKEYYRGERGASKKLESRLQTKFGMSTKDYNELLEGQNGVCAICGTAPGNKLLAVDHNHATDKVRGLLCSPCNVGIGFLQDSPVVIRNALKYLKDNGHEGK